MSNKTDVKKYVQDTWKELPAPVKIAIVIIIALILWRIVAAIGAWWKARREQDVLENNTYTVTNNESGTASTVNLGQVAASIRDAFYNNDWFGWTEDEDAAIKAIGQVPKSMIPQLSQIYFTLTQKNLQDDFRRFLSTYDYEQIAIQKFTSI